MKIAVPYENGQVFQHFGHIQQMKIYDAENGKMVQEQIADTTGGIAATISMAVVEKEGTAAHKYHCHIIKGNRRNILWNKSFISASIAAISSPW